jgi:L-ascorbate metabolism protein UlaG (beta-lactamase superfamily)
MQLTHLGHACLLVETDKARLLIDPGVDSSFADVRDLDAVLVTHQHPDHIDVAGLSSLLAANPNAALYVDSDTVTAVAGLPAHTVARPGDRLSIAGSAVDVVGDLHAAVYKDIPGCTNVGYLIDDGALLHPGDSFVSVDQDVDVLAVAIDAPWLKMSESIDYVHATGPRVAVPIHEAGATAEEVDKYCGMLAAFSPAGVVHRLTRGSATTL